MGIPTIEWICLRPANYLKSPFSSTNPQHVAHRCRRPRRRKPQIRPSLVLTTFRGLHPGDTSSKTITIRRGPLATTSTNTTILLNSQDALPHPPLSTTHHACHHSNLRISTLQTFSTRHITLRNACHALAVLSRSFGLSRAHPDPLSAQEAGHASAHGRGRRLLVASACLLYLCAQPQPSGPTVKGASVLAGPRGRRRRRFPCAILLIFPASYPLLLTHAVAYTHQKVRSTRSFCQTTQPQLAYQRSGRYKEEAYTRRVHDAQSEAYAHSADDSARARRRRVQCPWIRSSRSTRRPALHSDAAHKGRVRLQHGTAGRLHDTFADPGFRGSGACGCVWG